MDDDYLSKETPSQKTLVCQNSKAMIVCGLNAYTRKKWFIVIKD